MPSYSHIFGTDAKVKIMRLFVFNPAQTFTPKDVALRSKEKSTTARKEVRSLLKGKVIKKKGSGFGLNTSYENLIPLRNFLVDMSPITHKEIIKKINKTGTIKLILITGTFTHDPESRIDLLVVGDNIKEGLLSRAVSSIEAEIGQELRYASFETEDFKYRVSIYDKLVRDILDFPHKKILNKLGI